MAEVTWFKVLTDIFADDKIKIIQSMPEGDSLLVLWFKVLSQAGKTNDGGYIYLRKNIPYTPAMLATLFNKPQMIVELALKTFTQFEMIDVDDNGYIFVTNWEKHQSIDKLNQIKEKTRLRVQSHREKKKQELLESSVTVTLQKHQSNATDIEVDKEKDTTTDDFKIVHDEFLKIHGMNFMKPKDMPVITELLSEGIDKETIIEVMSERFQLKKASGESINGFSYYVEPIRARHRFGKKEPVHTNRRNASNIMSIEERMQIERDRPNEQPLPGWLD